MPARLAQGSAYIRTDDRRREVPAPDRRALELHRRLPGYAPTPLVESRLIADRLEVGRLFIKDESHRLGLPSFKVLGASWAVYRVLRDLAGPTLDEWSSLDQLRRLLRPLRPLTLLAATDGNHGRAVAYMARLLGFHSRIFVPEGTSPERIRAIAEEGADVVVVRGTYDDAVRHSATEADERSLVISDTSWPGYEDVPSWVIEGYSTIFFEIEEQLRALGCPTPDVVAVQVGVGALASAAARYCARLADSVRLIAVEPATAACLLASLQAGRIVSVPGPHNSIMAGLNCDTPSLIAWPELASSIDVAIAVADERAREAMRLLAAEGLISGESGAAGIAGLLELTDNTELEAARSPAGLAPEATVLALSTEGATDEIAYRRIVGDLACGYARQGLPGC
jgi:diaminopropionate ammonia-lyase